jgi:hypothetical protein
MGGCARRSETSQSGEKTVRKRKKRTTNADSVPVRNLLKVVGVDRVAGVSEEAGDPATR